MRLDLSLTISTKHTREELKRILENGIRCMFPNNDKHFNSIEFAEEADIYSTNNGIIKWEYLKTPTIDGSPK